MNTIFNLLVFINLIILIKCELFSAIAGLEQMIQIEENILKSIATFISDTEEKLNYLDSSYTDVVKKKNHSHNVKELRNFETIKLLLLNIGWNYALDWAAESKSYSEIIRHLQYDYKFPTKNDLNGAIEAILRLQETYRLNATNLANGQIKGFRSLKMSISDCFYIGYGAFNIKMYHYSIIWFELALERLSKEHNPNQILKTKVLAYLVLSYMKEKNFAAAQKVNEQILAIDLENWSSLINREKIKEGLLKGKKSITEIRQFDEDLIAKRIVEFEHPMEHIQDPMNYPNDFYETRLYEAVCRGDISPKPKQLAPLRCRYVTNKIPFLMIAPFKLEEISLDPYIIVYHDVMYDKEIDVVKDISQPQLERAGVTSDDKEANKARVSKSAFLENSDHKYIADISIRVTDMTGLSEKSAEELQVVNYGIGGFYHLHYDFTGIGDNAFDSLGVGNRIATVLFYMSDVTFGGSTAFPIIKTAIPPKKGSAVVWWNLYNSGVRDLRTVHAGCPVIIGSKWVSNKWIHSHHQELLKPCGLKPDHPPDQIDD